MKRLLIIVEGDTEKNFIDKVLAPYLYTQGLKEIRCFKIKHSKGGLSKYSHLKKDIKNCVFENNVLVSTLIDFYALPNDFPQYEQAQKIKNSFDRADFLENAIVEDISKSTGKSISNLLPYIQVHEFEALVFSSLDTIISLYDTNEADFEELKKVIDTYPNPEDINNDPETAPSKRLQKHQLIKGYNKIIDGIIIIETTGIETILKKCTRFNSWVKELIEKVNE
ncbi:MAG: DUF4276 family protein [Weeksellaceae bacterium]